MRKPLSSFCRLRLCDTKSGRVVGVSQDQGGLQLAARLPTPICARRPSGQHLHLHVCLQVLEVECQDETGPHEENRHARNIRSMGRFENLEAGVNPWAWIY